MTSTTDRGSTEPGIRLQRVLAAAGLGSRRACEELIAAGRVSVDGRQIREQGVRVDPALAVITVDGERVATDPRLTYLAVNKPRGMLTTLADPDGRPCVGDLLGGRSDRLFHVGRLDLDSEGLLIVTNDGDLAHRVTHPSFGIPKTYLAEIRGPVARGLGRQLRAGIELEDGPARVEDFRLVDSAGRRVLVELVVREGRNRLVRRLLESVGHPVARLVRTAVGPVQLGDLRPGRTRPLSAAEVGGLLSASPEIKS